MPSSKTIKNMVIQYPSFIQTYNEEHIEKLRNLYSGGIPLSIIMLSHPMCVGYCFDRSIQFSQIMPKFKIIRGNINVLLTEESPNHSWVEDNRYVYETTDNCKYDKDLYYSIYEPKIIETITEETCINDEMYLDVLNEDINRITNMNAIELILEVVELLEKERPTVNYDLLLKEIELFRSKNHLKPMYYKKYVKFMSKKMFPNYYNSIK